MASAADDKGPMHCSVVIPCHGSAGLTRACVDSLLMQQGGPPAEILLVDNKNDPATSQLATLHPHVRVLPQPHNRGFAGGVNVGWRAASQPLVLVLNNDTQAAENLFVELADALRSSPTIGAVAPLSNHVKGPARIAVGQRGASSPGRAAIAAELQTGAVLQDVDTLAGLCLLLRRHTLEEVGGFDERFGHGNFEDDDLSLRLRLAGYRLVLARRAFLHHEGHATFRALGLDLDAELVKRRTQFISKWREDPAGRAVMASWREDIAGAADAAEAARRLHPRWADADLHLARLHEALGDHTAAAHHYAAMLANCPQHPDAAIGLGLSLLRTGQVQAAHRVLREALAEHHLTATNLVHLWRELGKHAYGHGQFIDAAGHFADALAWAPDDGELANWLGLSHLASGQFAAAARAFDQALQAGFPLAATNLGICQHRLGDIAAAEQSFLKAFELLPHDPVARANHEAVLACQRATAASR